MHTYVYTYAYLVLIADDQGRNVSKMSSVDSRTIVIFFFLKYSHCMVS